MSLAHTAPNEQETSTAAELVVEELTTVDPRFFGLTFAGFRGLVAERAETVTAVGASVDGIAAGLALGQIIGETKQAGGLTAELLSLMVAAPYRGQHIGALLLSRLEAILAARGAVGIFALHSSRLQACAPFERTIAAAGWLPPQFRELRFAGECGLMIPAVTSWPVYNQRLSNPGRYSFTPWSDVAGDDDQAAIERLCRQPPCTNAPLIQPKSWATRYDPAISLAVRRDGVLVGWVAAHRLEKSADKTATAPELYYVSYLDSALQRSGIMVAAYVRAFQLQAAAYGDRSVALYVAVEPGMVAITRRRFGPIARRNEEIRISGRRLTPGRQPGESSIGPTRESPSV